MSEKFQNKYRSESIRLKGWDYRWQGSYFITICTKDRINHFGEVIDNKMHLSNIGVLADVFWYELKTRNPTIELDEYVIMPNHIHGIIHIVDSLHATNPLINDATNPPINDATNPHTDHAISTIIEDNKNDQMASISPKSGSISTIIRSYKSAVSKHAHRLEFEEFNWQSKFWDHIIRSNDSYQRIKNYIVNNPENWGKDKFN